MWNYESRPDGSVSVDLLFPLAEILGVESRWLATGDGVMADSETPSLEALKVEQVARALVRQADDKLQALSVLLGIKLR